VGWTGNLVGPCPLAPNRGLDGLGGGLVVASPGHAVDDPMAMAAGGNRRLCHGPGARLVLRRFGLVEFSGRPRLAGTGTIAVAYRERHVPCNRILRYGGNQCCCSLAVLSSPWPEIHLLSGRDPGHRCPRSPRVDVGNRYGVDLDYRIGGAYPGDAVHRAPAAKRRVVSTNQPILNASGTLDAAWRMVRQVTYDRRNPRVSCAWSALHRNASSTPLIARWFQRLATQVRPSRLSRQVSP